ncbi:FadR/GntR family transcriptional regulator [Metabacillus sp. JX24]|uniref:FadR/GntR family transcriptional regulator n=1 Tax=Metabacillus sp. JX24 TaxID=3240759 RepID=UPI00350F9D65
MSASKPKVYIEILREIRSIIKEDGLAAGDKIPSERELAERLQAGRSSVREALRALELLGIIETRRGEGTFIKDFRDNDLVEILGTFILQDKNAISDLTEMNKLLEYNALQVLLTKDREAELKELRDRLKQEMMTRAAFMTELMKLSDNFLLYRIWTVVSEYVKLIQPKPETGSQAVYKEIIDGLLSKDENRVFQSFYTLAHKESADKA